VVLQFEVRALHLLGRCLTLEPHLQPENEGFLQYYLLANNQYANYI
jgi:hypothetical protein